MDFHESDACDHEREPNSWETIVHSAFRDTFFTRCMPDRPYDEAVFVDRGHHIVCRLPDAKALGTYVHLAGKQYDEEKRDWVYTMTGRIPGRLSDYDFHKHPRWSGEGRDEFDRMQFSAGVRFTVITDRDLLPSTSYTTIPYQQHVYRNVETEYDTEIPHRPAAPESEERKIFARIAAMMAGVTVLVGSCMYAGRSDERTEKPQGLRPSVQPRTSAEFPAGYDPSMLHQRYAPLSVPESPGYTSPSLRLEEFPSPRSRTDLPR